MLPDKRNNIYPRTEENSLAVIDFFVTTTSDNRQAAVDRVKQTHLSLNQIEFLLKQLSEAADPLFSKHFGVNIDLDNLVSYGVDALVHGECKYGSKNRIKITQEFKEF